MRLKVLPVKPPSGKEPTAKKASPQRIGLGLLIGFASLGLRPEIRRPRHGPGAWRIGDLITRGEQLVGERQNLHEILCLEDGLDLFFGTRRWIGDGCKNTHFVFRRGAKAQIPILVVFIVVVLILKMVHLKMKVSYY